MASDHAGFAMKQYVKELMLKKGFEVIDFGADSEESCDYADYAHPLASALESGELVRGLAFCGSGNGINITLNRHKGIRSAYCWNQEIASLARAHNDANICTIPARFLLKPEVEEIIDAFLTTDFEGGRHQNRINKI